MNPEDVDIEALVNDREAFNAFVYTPLDEALAELEKRRELNVFIDNSHIPEIIIGKPKALIFRQVITPNYEVIRFISIIDAIGLDPVFIDHNFDKFIAKNDWKYFLGKIFFNKGVDKNGKNLQEGVRIIDFNEAEGKLMTNIKTIWGESLVDFHRNLFLEKFPHFEKNIFDASSWLLSHGKGAREYYKPFFRTLIQHAILFENFMLDQKELPFIKEVILPAFIDVLKETGLKPLIVALEPTEIEGERFWMCHPDDNKDKVKNKIKNCPQDINSL